MGKTITYFKALGNTLEGEVRSDTLESEVRSSVAEDLLCVKKVPSSILGV